MCPDVYIRAACHLRSVVSTIFITFEQRAVIRHAVFACRKRINNPQYSEQTWWINKRELLQIRKSSR